MVGGTVTYRHISVAVHGPWGAGKSWFGDTAPGPRLILDAEGGTLDTPSNKIEWDPHNDIPKVGEDDTVHVLVRGWNDIELVRAVLMTGKHPIDSIVVDSLTEIQKRLKDRLSGGPEVIFDQQAWGKLLNHMEQFVRELRDHTWADAIHPINMVVVTGTDDERVPMKPMFQGGLRKSYAGFFDVVGYITPERDTDGNKAWHMQIEPTQAVVAKCRLHEVSVQYPGGVVLNPTMGKLLAPVNPGGRDG